MASRIAVVGAGPSGIAAAKAALECSLEPVVFEAGYASGGLWRRNEGYIWRDMRTNLSKWTCSFSDYPWPAAADDFPHGSAVEHYVREYAGDFGVEDRIAYGQRITGISKCSNGWAVDTNDQNAAPATFDGVIVATGIFARKFIPRVSGLLDFKGRLIHSGDYREAGDFRGRRVAVVGGSLSGVEIATHLADHGIEVILLFERAPWILPRYAPVEDQNLSAPLDLVLYNRKDRISGSGQALSLEDKNRATAAFFESTFGNAGDVSEALRTPVDGTPPYVAISDNFLDHVSSGLILPVRERLKGVGASYVTTEEERSIYVDDIVFCTGYESDLSFLAETIRSTVEYNARDKLVAHIACDSVVHPELQDLYFVGMYRGPYFGVMELQARWAAMMLAGEIEKPAETWSARKLDSERSIRGLRPRPQFPHGDYVEFADAIASRIGVYPNAANFSGDERALKEGPVIPAHYRLNGPHAKRGLAADQIRSACARVGLA